MKIYVWSPNYTHQSVGIRVMHYLMFLLKKLGHDVFTNALILNYEYCILPTSSPLITPDFDMCIFPEMVNTKGFEKMGIPTLRWVLYYLEKDTMYDKIENVYHWKQTYEKDAVEHGFWKQSTEFRLGMLDKKEFQFIETKRNGDLFWVYKGKNAGAHPEGALEITKEFPSERKCLLELLRTHKTFYSYDRDTALSIEAVLMGMQSKVWNYDLKIWEDFVVPYAELMDDLSNIEKVKWLLKDFCDKTVKRQGKYLRIYYINP